MMIARIWVGVTPADRTDAYLAYLQKTGLAEYATVKGHRATFVLRQIKDDRATFTIVTHWDSMDAIEAFAGETPEIAKYYPEDDDYLIERRPTVEHHEVIWTDIADR
ncbi:MAG: antibiotic biosynthesis monooxygenase [Thermomicrobiales bacterium]